MENREYVIVTDSTADMDPQYYSVNNVEVLGLHYTIDHQQFTQCSSKDMDTKSFYDRVRRGSMPETTPISYEDATNCLEKLVSKGYDVFFLSFSGGLSASFQNTQIAAEDIMAKHPEATIKVVDSICATNGQGLLLHMCVKKKNTGISLDELVKFAERTKHHLVHLVVVDSLHHLHRGGRLSKASAIIGSILHVKPLICVDDNGKLVNYGKASGRKKAIAALAEHMKAKYIVDENEEIFIGHGDCLEDAETLGNLILSKMPDVKRIRYIKVGPVIGAHAGADGLVLAFVGKNRLPVE
ncbi:MAG: DegV family protein [Oscillospiraceae bacterium]|nr:DegV family protein [Oscillospiraceae bacterium]